MTTFSRCSGVKDVGGRKLATHPEIEEVSTTVTLIQALIPLGLRAVGEALATEVTRLVGPRYSRTSGIPGHVRWGHQQGSISLADQKLPITYQRVRDRRRKTEVPLTTYQQLQVPRQADAGLFRKVLLGLSFRNDAGCAEAVPEACGLSPSTVSRRFIRASVRQLQALQERWLDTTDVVVLLLDGKTCAEDSMVIALGITLTGEKVILGFVQTATENETVCAAFLRELVERVCVIDEPQGLRKAIQTVFGDYGIVQRCQWHTRENVFAYLPTRQRASVRRRLQAAHEQPTEEAATRAFSRLRQELRLLNASAVTSLDEGFEETLDAAPLGPVPPSRCKPEDDQLPGVAQCAPRAADR